MKTNVITENNITQLVNKFYTKVRADDQLGPIFAEAVGESNEEWEPHLRRMVDFWSSIMITSRNYHGNPIKKHQDLPGFDINLFDRWLALFAETAHELYVREIADKYINRSRRIAERLKLALYNDAEFQSDEEIAQRYRCL